jgi:ferric-chelate reductase
MPSLPALDTKVSRISDPVASSMAPSSPTLMDHDTVTEFRPLPRTHGSDNSTYDLEKASQNTLDTQDVFTNHDISGVDLQFGRPDVHRILEEAVKASVGPVSVDGKSCSRYQIDTNVYEVCLLVSGPEALVAAVRSALSSSFADPLSVLRGGANVQLNVEDFTM